MPDPDPSPLAVSGHAAEPSDVAPAGDERPRLERRRFLAAGVGLGLWLASGGRGRAGPAPSAERCVLVWLEGGPSQLETFDPKPGAPTGGPTRAIETAVPGLRFAEHLPLLAERADRLAVIRSLTSREGDHRRASYLLQTGFRPAAALRHPAWGSVLSAELGVVRADVPAFVALGGGALGPGYLGGEHASYAVRPGAAGALVPRPELPAERRAGRRRLLQLLEAPFARAHGAGGEGSPAPRAAALARADALLAGPLHRALDLSAESAEARACYGDSEAGAFLLAARRLLEAGARCVHVRVPGWDDHQDLFARLPARARALDRALAALLDDLAERGRLSRTLVACLGEFGRTPDVNARGGRDHYPRAFSAVLAGGGVPGGVVVGATDSEGREVVERPVRVPDLFATLARLHGLDPEARRYAGERPLTLVDGGRALRELLPG